MITASRIFSTALLLSLFTSSAAYSAVSKNLPYKSSDLSATEIIEQVYFVNHFFAYKNYSIQKQGNKVTALISKAKGGKPTIITLTRYLNNNYSGGAVKAKDLAMFHSGKLRGTGMLITDYNDDSKSQSYMIWLPALRKIRRFSQPAHDDAWGGSDFTFGDVVLRKPHHEKHQLLGTETFKSCLGSIKMAASHRNRYTKNLPKASCAPKGKKVYKVKSTTKFKNWWYDHRISYIDTKTFADYRTEYFKKGKKVKVIDRDWKSMRKSDPRALSWGYWYGKDLKTGHETWAVIPSGVNKVNISKPQDFWSEKTLRKLKR